MESTPGIKYITPSVLNFYSFGMKNLSVSLQKPNIELIATKKSNELIFNELSGKIKDEIVPLLLIIEHFIEKYHGNKGIEFHLVSKFPTKAGLGFFESLLVGMLLSVNELNKFHLDKKEIFLFIKDSKILTNLNLSSIASILYGGFINYDKDIYTSVQKIYNPKGLIFSIFASERFEKFIDRNLISDIDISSEIIGFTKAMITADVTLLKEVLHSKTFEVNSIDDFGSQLYELALGNDALGFGICQERKSFFVIYENTVIRDHVDAMICEFLNKSNYDFKCWSSAPDLNGAYKS